MRRIHIKMLHPIILASCDSNPDGQPIPDNTRAEIKIVELDSL